MILNLNGSRFYSLQSTQKLLIEIYSGKLPAAFDLVSFVFYKRGDEPILIETCSTTQLPQTPSMIIVTIAATRIYRSLINICSSEM